MGLHIQDPILISADLNLISPMRLDSGVVVEAMRCSQFPYSVMDGYCGGYASSMLNDAYPGVPPSGYGGVPEFTGLERGTLLSSK